MVSSVNLGKEIHVSLENKVGILADISKTTAEHGINIEALAGYVEDDKKANIMLVTDDNRRTMDALKKKGYESVEENEVVIVETANKPGALKVLAEKLAENGIDIKYSYATTCKAECPARIVMGTSDNEKVVVLFRK